MMACVRIGSESMPPDTIFISASLMLAFFGRSLILTLGLISLLWVGQRRGKGCVGSCAVRAQG